MNRINSKRQLITIIKDYNKKSSNDWFGANKDASEITTDDASTESTEYSKTNTQVEGVDEADIVKTDGIYCYLISQNKVIITKSYPVIDMEVEKIITYENFKPNFLYVDEDYLVVIGTSYQETDYIYNNKSKVYIYNKLNYDEVKDEIEIDGYITTTRKVNNQLLVVAHKYISYYQTDDDIKLPSYKINDEKEDINYNELYYKE